MPESKTSQITSANPILVISCSLNPTSKSNSLALAAVKHYESADVPVEHVDLRNVELPFCDAASCYQDPLVAEMKAKIERASGILLACPIYNFDVNAVAKNLVELTGKAWNDKVVGFLCAAGGRASYMSVMSFANSLMLDFRCLVLPRFVYADYDDFESDAVVSDSVQERISELCNRMATVASALK